MLFAEKLTKVNFGKTNFRLMRIIIDKETYGFGTRSRMILQDGAEDVDGCKEGCDVGCVDKLGLIEGIDEGALDKLGTADGCDEG